MNHMVFYIEGNIGAGKSTIIERMEIDLKKNTPAIVYAYTEPVDIWTGIHTKIIKICYSYCTRTLDNTHNKFKRSH